MIQLLRHYSGLQILCGKIAMTIRKPAGGAATAGGMNYQYRVTAWVAVQVLAEKEMPPPWELPSGTTLEWLRCKTEQPVDDLIVGTSEGGLIFSQVKHTLQLSASLPRLYPLLLINVFANISLTRVAPLDNGRGSSPSIQGETVLCSSQGQRV